ncbi:uncharacterized protein TRIADDRAFT_53851 [Trichoplax adhaerens]|uniref:Uncharacterized protein n=1 Tax=Trichoplax adhaerens TaxID=10228 RepID=B3RQC0_TRIAD|nr:hypothetical protein TRIADDRAFT_53851 [Trichoplax adhaerens]EDV27803.1 hypothetical protein TRIADDRAFT_53851 [Trichoplax adhaerens]|eukprot:XP_002109637.1 hypothetical protein TRIADDRAFT_53851 [Trichoplax adhaerens]
MPKESVVLSITSLLGWLKFSIFAVFYTNFIGQSIFKGDPNAAENSTALQHYNAGVRYGSWDLALCTLATTLYSIIVRQLSFYCNAKYVNAVGFLLISIATVVMAFLDNVVPVICLASMQGVGFASIFTLPFAILDSYREYFVVNLSNIICYFKLERRDKRWFLRDYGIDISILINSSLLCFIIISFAGRVLIAVTHSPRSAIVLSAGWL